MTTHIDAPHSRGARRPDRGQLFGTTFVFGIFGVCLTRLLGFVQDNAVDLLFNDQWDALGPIFAGQGPWKSFLMQHGPPRMGLGGVMTWFLYNATHWNVRAEAWAGVVVLALATMVALALAARLRGRLAWSDAAFPLLLLSPVHWETLVFTPFVGAKILPLLLVLLTAYAWSVDRPVVRAIGVGLFGTLALFTGYGFCSAPVIAGLALFLWLRPSTETARADRRSAPSVLLIMGAALALFLFRYHWSPGTKEWQFPVPNWWDYPRFGALLFTNLVGWRTLSVASTAAGAVLLSFVVGAFLATAISIGRRRATVRDRVVWSLTGTSLAYATLTAIGRLPTTVEAAFMWRYITLMMPALIGLSFAAEAWTSSRGPKWRLGFATAWVALAAIVWGNFTPEIYAATLAKGKRLWVASYLQTRDLNAANQAADFGIYSADPSSPLVAEKLRWLEERNLSFFRKLPDKK